MLKIIPSDSNWEINTAWSTWIDRNARESMPVVKAVAHLFFESTGIFADQTRHAFQPLWSDEIQCKVPKSDTDRYCYFDLMKFDAKCQRATQIATATVDMKIDTFWSCDRWIELELSPDPCERPARRTRDSVETAQSIKTSAACRGLKELMGLYRWTQEATPHELLDDSGHTRPMILNLNLL